MKEGKKKGEGRPRGGYFKVGVGGGINPPSRGVQHWYTPTILAPTHCAQTFLVVVCSVHKMRPIKFSLRLSWRYFWLCRQSENIGNP